MIAPPRPALRRILGAGLLLRVLLLLCLVAVSTANAAPTTVFHSPADDGVLSTGAVDIPGGAPHTVYLYIDAGSTPSPESRCSAGTGDEVCA